MLTILWLAAAGVSADETTPASITIKGLLKDKRGEAIIGGTVRLENTSIGTVTNYDGDFILKNVPPNRTVKLIISYIGYKTLVKEINFTSDANLDVVLEEDALGLDEVIILGYTQTKKNSQTGAISSIKSEQISATSATSFNEQIQGQAPGLIVSGTSGTPGSSVFIRLRGTTSINAGNDPLYIIDGVPFNSNTLQTISVGGQTTNPLSDLNPSDIEHIEILKDANATAVYGARGANGVILVSTKRGRKGRKTQVNLTIEQGIAKAAKLWDLATGSDHAQILTRLG